MAEELFDLTIRGGLLVDGSGAHVRQGDVGVRHGRIAALGSVRGPTLREIDASDCVVAPGFIDAHTHYDAQLLWDRAPGSSHAHGVTTVVIGSSGAGIAPAPRAQRERVLRALESVSRMTPGALCYRLGDDWGLESFGAYLDAIQARGTLVNVGAFVGHTPIRIAALGAEASERAATPDEIVAMSRSVAAALRAGALGFATSKSEAHLGYGGRPLASRAAELAEISALAANLGHLGRGVLQVGEGRGLGLRELAWIAHGTGRPVSWAGLWTRVDGGRDPVEVLKRSAELQARGLAVVPQVSCRPLLAEFQFKEPAVLDERRLLQPVLETHPRRAQIHADPVLRACFREVDRFSLPWRWERTVVSSCPGHPELEERSVAEIACERRRHPSDVALELASETGMKTRFRVALANTEERDVAELLRHPAVMLGLSGSGGKHAPLHCDACFPTHLLGHLVRDMGMLCIEQAVWLLTGRSAEILGIEDRGRLALGLAADVTVFDPARVGCGPPRRVRLPFGERWVSDPLGIRAVIVNGELIREEDRELFQDPDAELPGRLLRGGVA